MKKFSFIVTAIAALAVAAPVAVADEVVIADPVGVFTDTKGNAGYAEVDTDEGAIRACNENEATPAGDQLTGYIYLNANGSESFSHKDEPAYAVPGFEGYGGAGDADGDTDTDASNGTESNDCPAHGGADNPV